MVDKFNTGGGDYSAQEEFLNQTAQQETPPPVQEAPPRAPIEGEDPTSQVSNVVPEPTVQEQLQEPEQPVEETLPETNLGQEVNQVVDKTQQTLETPGVLPAAGTGLEAEQSLPSPKQPKPPGPGELDIKSIATSLYYEKESNELQQEDNLREQFGDTTWGNIKSFANRLWQSSGAAGAYQGLGVATVNSVAGVEMAIHYAKKLDPIQAAFDYFDPDGANFRELAHEKFQEAAGEVTKGIEEAVPVTNIAGEIAGSATKFAVGFAGAGKLTAGIKAIKATPSLVEDMTQWGLAQYLGFDEHATNMADMLNEVPALQGIVPDFMTHKEGDNPFEARLKNAVDGALGAGIGHAVIGGLTTLKKLAPKGWIKDTEGLRPTTVIDEVPDMAKKGGLTPEQELLMTQTIKSIAGGDKKTLYEMGRDTTLYIMQGAMLSAPSTHALNALSNGIVQVNSLGERIIARGLTKANIGLKGKEGVAAGEVSAHLQGMYTGVSEGFSNAAKYYKTGESAFGGTEKLLTSSSLVKVLGKDVNEVGLGLKVLSSVTDVPGKALGASDELFKSVSFQTEMAAQLQRVRVQQGLPPGAKPKLSAEELGDLIQKAKNKANYETFTNDLGPFAKTLGKLRNQMPESKFIVPFFDTLTNIVTYSVDHIPGAALMFSKNRAAWKEGGVEGVEFLSKQVMGGMYGLMGFGLYNTGVLTGGNPLDWGETTTKQASGWQPYSVKVGDKFIPFDKIPGIGFVMRTTVDLIEAIEKGSELASQDDTQNMFAPALTHYMHGVSNLFLDNSWAEGLTEALSLLDVRGDVEQVGDKYWDFVENQFLKLIPNVLKRTAMSAEDNLKEANGFIDKLKKSIPGMTSELPDAYDIYGRVKANPYAGGKALSPLKVTSDTPESNFDKYFAERNLDLDPPRYTQSFDGVSINLKEHPGIMSEMMKLTGTLENSKPPYGGRTLHQYLEDLVSGSEDPTFLDSKKEEQERVVRNALNSYRDLARQEILLTNEEFALEVDTRKMQQEDQKQTINQLMGK